MYRIACVILNFNDYETTEKLLLHIKDFKAINNIVVVDNNSTDKSFNKLQSLESDNIKVIKSHSNKGYGAGNNIGILYAKNVLECEYVIIANPDVYFTEEFVYKCVKALADDPQVAIVSGIMLNKDNEPIENAWKLPNAFGEVVDASSILRRLHSLINRRHKVYSESSSEHVDVLSGSLFIAKVDKLFEVGLFDEEVFLYGEENILAKKMQKSGYKELRLNSISFTHLHSTSIDKAFKNMFLKRRLLINSKKQIIRKYHEINSLYLLLLNLLLSLTLVEAAIIEGIKIGINKRGKKDDGSIL